jgi:CHAT domain-containing protein/tetratricopeptide (TPR) repeat protein
MTTHSSITRHATIACAIALLVLQVAAHTQAPADSEWRTRDARAAALYLQGDLSGAIDAARAALDAASSPSETGHSLDRLGFFYYTAGNAAEGQKYLQQSLDVRQTAFGIDSLEYAETANDLAMLLRDAHKIEEARTLAQRSVDIRRRLLKADDPLYAESLNTAGTVLGIGGEYAAAVTQFEQALAIHESKAAAERATEEYGTLCINLAGTYQRLGKYAQAEATFSKGLAALRVSPGVGHPAYAVSLSAFAMLEVELGRFADAERAYAEADTRLRATLTDKHPLYATFLNNQGFLFHTIGNTTAAEANYRASLALRRELKVSPVTVASTLRNLGFLVYERDRTESERLLTEAVEAYSSTSSAPPFDLASVLLGLGRAQRDRGALGDARATLERALAVAQQGLSARHPLVANAYRELGLLYAASGDNTDADAALRRALAIAEDAHGPNHPALSAFLDTLAEHYASHGDYESAQPLYRRSFDIRDRFLSDVLEVGSESAKVLSMVAAADPLPALLAFQAQAATRVPDARVLAFEVVTQRKARVLEQVRDSRQRLRSNASESVQRQLLEWQAVLECRTSLTVALGYADLKPVIAGPCGLTGTDLTGRYERLLSDLRTARTDDTARQAVAAIAVLRERGDALEASLNREAGDPRGSAARLSVDAISRELGDDELLIELVSYKEAARSGRQRFGAFVLDNRGALDWTDIGLAAPIDSAARDMLRAANDWAVSVRNGEARAARSSESTARETLAVLSEKLWKPLQPLVDRHPNVRRLRIAPDGSLNLVPFDALSDGHELIDRFAITYIPAGRDLATAASSHAATSPIVVVSPGATVRAAAAQPAQGSAFRAGTLTRLPAAAGEASDLRRLIPSASIYSGASATERQLKNVHGPSLLHIIGHGIVLGEDTCAQRTCLPAEITPSVNAMSLSAIVLEEAYGRGGVSVDDGMLTPLELQNVDLRGTEMLVLSQCQMASGVPSVGEGVYGMRRAAAIAGARSFVAPLWNVEDGVERTMMDRFYRGLAAGQTRSDALKSAKLAVRRSPATRSFLYWAPLILSGSAAAIPPAVFR